MKEARVLTQERRLAVLGLPRAEPSRFSVAPAFAHHFRNLKQVFLYITDECNIACKQCIYKPSVAFGMGREISRETAISLGVSFYELGARKLTILGGEPTLYGIEDGHRSLFDVISGYREIGYSYLRLDTNGIFEGLLEEPRFQQLDEIAFSLDGHNAALNDPVRGLGTFERIVQNICRALTLGYRVTITCCIQRALLKRDEAGRLGIENMIRFAEELGVSGINFHDLFKVGVPMDAWTGDLNTTVRSHVEMYGELAPRIADGEFGVAVRLPQCFVTAEEFSRNPRYYGYCPVKLGERVMVHPNGTIRVCSNLICSEFGIGRYSEDKIVWDESGTNESLGHALGEMTPCTNRSRNKTYGEFVPLCFSFKPGQTEPVWRDALRWDERRLQPRHDTRTRQWDMAYA